jgi:hypothetical protein
MTTMVLEVKVEPRIERLESTDRYLIAHLKDGRILSVPLGWYPRLEYGSPEERSRYELAGDGYAVHWPDLDEDIHVEGLLAGARSGESAASLGRWLASRTR